MRHTRIVSTTCAAVLLGVTTVSGQKAPAGGPPAGVPAAASPWLSARPLQRLFTAPTSEAERTRQLLERARQRFEDVHSGSTRRFICGMPVLQADPAVDPTSIVPPPDTGTRFEIQTVQPSCR